MQFGWAPRTMAAALAVAAISSVACSGAPKPRQLTASAPPTTTTTSAPTTTTEAPTTTVAPAPPPTSPPVTAARSRPTRQVVEQAWTPFAQVAEVTLHHPSSRIERIGFHESSHDGARQMTPLPTAARPFLLETRERGTGSHTAADIVADPAVEIRSPVSGTVKRAGSYILYCDTRDYYVVIEPDSRPGWEVKVLHMTGMQVAPGQRVEAGVTVLAPGPRQLPFESQVDESAPVKPAWPHVHVEVVDPSIPDRPSPGPGC